MTLPSNDRDPLVRNYRQFRIRLRRRRLFQGCAILLLLPTAAAFLPVQGRAPQRTLALVPVTPPPAAVHPIILPAASKPKTLPALRHSLLQAASRFPLRKLSQLSGLASWYGNVLRGHRTASGERFDPDALTACHPTLPFGTLVRVINLVNHRSVLVRINDRGVLNPDRVIDLSSAAAEQLDMLRAGVAPVKLEVQSVAPQHDRNTSNTEFAAATAP